MPVIINTAWAKGVNGSWNTGSDWTESVPLQGGNAFITVGGTYTVTSSQSNSVGNLEMQRKATLAIDTGSFEIRTGTETGMLDGTISVGDATTLDLGTDSTSTTFVNDGAIDVFGPNITALHVAGVVALNGSGKINLLDGNNNDISSDGTVSSLTSSNTISGSGTIGDSDLSFVNAAKGVVNANNSNGVISIRAKQLSNSGLLESTEGSVLFIASETNQTASGRIVAAAGTQLQLQQADIFGGEVSIAKNASLAFDPVTPPSGTNTISPLKPLINAGTIDVSFNRLVIDGPVKNTGTLSAGGNGGTIVIGGAVGGKAEIANSGQIVFDSISSTAVSFDAGSTGILDLADAAQFKGSVAGMSAAPGASIDLENILFADHPTIAFSRGLLTVTDPTTKTVDKIKIVGIAGSFTKQVAGDGSTLIFDPMTSSLSVPSANTRLLVQSMASFAVSKSVSGGTGNAEQPHHLSSDFVAAPHPG